MGSEPRCGSRPSVAQPRWFVRVSVMPRPAGPRGRARRGLTALSPSAGGARRGAREWRRACVRRQRGLLLQRERPDQLHDPAGRRPGGDGPAQRGRPEVRGRLPRALARSSGSELAERRDTGSLRSAVTSDKRACPAAVRKGVWFLAVTPVPLGAPHGADRARQPAPGARSVLRVEAVALTT